MSMSLPSHPSQKDKKCDFFHFILGMNEEEGGEDVMEPIKEQLAIAPAGKKRSLLTLSVVKIIEPSSFCQF